LSTIFLYRMAMKRQIQQKTGHFSECDIVFLLKRQDKVTFCFNVFNSIPSDEKKCRFYTVIF